MAAIEIDSGIKTQDFVRKSDGKKLTLSLRVGDVKSLSAWTAKAKDLEDTGRSFDNEKAVASTEKIAKEMICMLFDNRMWKKISKFCDGNIFAVIKIVVALSKLMKDGIEENVGK